MESTKESLKLQEGEELGFRFTQECDKKIYDYLNSKPMSEVEKFMTAYFENPNKDKIYLSQEGIQELIDFLTKKCPRVESKPILEMLANGGTKMFKIKNDITEKEEKSQN
jgi:hypothetical protein